MTEGIKEIYQKKRKEYAPPQKKKEYERKKKEIWQTERNKRNVTKRKMAERFG